MPPKGARKSATPKQVAPVSAHGAKKMRKSAKVEDSAREASDTEGTKLLRLLAINASPKALSITSSPPHTDDEHYRSGPFQDMPPLESEK